MNSLPKEQDEAKEFVRSQQFVRSRMRMRDRGTFAAGEHDGARARVVNRTHRVIREQAMTMQAQKKRTRSLWAPMIIFSSLMIVILYAIWGVLDGYDLTPNGVPDASDQMMLLLLWSLPVTAVMLGLIWLRRERGRTNGNGEVQR
jgi:cytochrome bd-type quinol oxidase subunit 1